MSRAPLQLAYVATLATAYTLTACNDLPELEYETQSLRIATGFEEPLCRGDLDYLEGVVTSLEAQLDTVVSDPIEVYIWGQLDETPPSWCDEGLLGCYRDGAVYTSQASLDHELVHAVIDTFADPPPFWDEGAAEALVSTRTLFSTSAPSNHLDAEEPDYGAAGHFSRWLLETHGLEKYRALLRHQGSGPEALEQVYGLSVDDAQAAYFDSAPNSYGALITCQHPELPSTGATSWAEEINIDCGQPHVYGGPLGMTARRVLTISERGHYSISTTAEGGVLLRCQDETYEVAPSLDQPELYGDVPAYTSMWINAYLAPLSGQGEPNTFDLAPGRYELIIGYSDFEARSAKLDVVAAAP